jgi:hypothetical protein
MASNDFAARRYMKLFVYLPCALHPQIRTALIVGYGMGNTAAALVANRELQHIDVADISRDILEFSRQMNARPTVQPLDDPRVQVHVEDGRQFLAGQTRSYDLITGEPPPPVMAGVVNLYTREYFQLVRARLAARGMTTHWLPMMNISDHAAKSIIAAFCAAFNDCSLWHGSARNLMLLGTRDAGPPVSAARYRQQWDDPAIRAELVSLGLDLPEQLGALFIGDASYLASLTQDDPPLTDDRPALIQRKGSPAQRDALLWEWRDTQQARERFLSSLLVARLWPLELRMQVSPQFENQRLLNDLLFPERTPVRQTRVLHQVLHNTPLQLPVLLLLNSDSDVQTALANASEAERARPQWRIHHVARQLSERNYAAALALVQSVPDDALPFADLREYLAAAAQRAERSP